MSVNCFVTKTGEISTLFNDIFTNVGDFDRSVQIYAYALSEDFKQRSKYQRNRNGEPPFGVVMKYLEPAFRSQRHPKWVTMFQNSNQILEDEQAKVTFQEDTHTYRFNNHESTGVTSYLNTQGLTIPFNKQELLDNLLKQHIKPTDDDTNIAKKKSNLQGYIEALETLSEPGTALHRAFETYITNAINQVGTTVKEEALEIAYQQLLKSDSNWFVDSSELKESFTKFVQDTLYQIRVIAPNGIIRPEQRLTYEDRQTKVAGTSDIVVVKEDGTVVTFDFKTSYHSLDQWNAYKNEASIYQQLIYGNMLRSKGLNVTDQKIIAVYFDVDFENSKIKKINSTSTVDLRSLSPIRTSFGDIEQNVNTLFPVLVTMTNAVYESNVKVADLFKQLFDYSLHVEQKEATQQVLSSEKDAVIRASDKYNNWILAKVSGIISSNSKTLYDPYSKKTIFLIPPTTSLSNTAMAEFYIKQLLNNPEIFTWYKAIQDNHKTAYVQLVDWINTQREHVKNDKELNPNVFVWKSPAENKQYSYILTQYITDPFWEVHTPPQFQELGIVGFYHTHRKIWQFVNIVDKNLNEHIGTTMDNKMSSITKILHDRRKGTILGKHLPARTLNNVDIAESVTHEYETIKLAAFIANNQELFKGAKIGKSNFHISLDGVPIKIADVERGQDQLNLVIAKSGLKTSISSNYSIAKDNFNSWLDELYMHVDRVLSSHVNLHDTRFLRQAEKQLLSKSFLSQTGRVSYKDYLTELSTLEQQYLDGVLSNMDKANKQKSILIEMLIDLENPKKGNLQSRPETFSELTAYVKSAILEIENMLPGFHNQSISIGTGFGSGNFMFNPLSTLVQTVEKNVRQIHDIATKKVTNRVYDFARNQHHPIVEVLYREKNLLYEQGANTLIGNFLPAYTNLFELDDKRRNLMRLRDPDDDTYDYLRKGQTKLTQAEKNYIKFIIATLNKYREQKMSVPQWSEFVKDSVRMRDLPLMRASATTNLVNKGIVTATQEMLADMMNPQNIFDEDTDYLSVQNERKYVPNMFDFYDSFENHGNRTDRINKFNIGETKVGFETNLELLLNSFVIANEKQTAFNEALLLVDAMRSNLILQSLGFGVDTNEELKFINNYIDANLYTKRSTLSGKEIDPIIEAVVHSTKHATSVVRLGLNVVSGVTQFGQAFFQVMSQVFAERGTDAPSLKSYQFASSVMLGESGAILGNITIANELNRLYGVNADIFNDSKFLTEQNIGLLSFGDRFLMWLNQAPDYFFRMLLFIAKMKEQGIWEAHSLSDGKLRYDVTKDKRFSEIFTKNGEIKTRLTDKGEQQLALYQAFIKELEKEGGLVDGKPVVAITSRELNSIKADADMLFGSYSKKDKLQASQTILGSLLLQFKTWLSSVKHQYWFNGKGKNSDTRGKNIVTEIGKTPEGKPIYGVKWESSYHEGIFNTLIWLGTELSSSTPNNFYNRLKDAWNNLSVAEKKTKTTNLKRLLSHILALLLIKLLQDHIFEKNNRYSKILYNSVKDAFFFNAFGFVVDDSNPFPSMTLVSDLISKSMLVGSQSLEGELGSAGNTLLSISGMGRTVSDLIDLGEDLSE